MTGQSHSLPTTARAAGLPWPGIVLVAGLLATALAVALLARSNRLAAERELEEHAHVVSAVIERRVARWGEVLHGVRGLYGASEHVSALEFRRFFDHLGLSARHPGFMSLQYLARVPGEQRASFEAMVEADDALMAEQQPPFRIRPAGDRAEYQVTLYVEPAAGNAGAFGLDAAHDTRRRAGFERARDSGGLTASGPLAPMRQPGRVGLELRLAIYRNGAPLATVGQRRAAWMGTAAVSLDANDFMASLIDPQLGEQVDVRVHDLGWADAPRDAPTLQNLLFDSVRAGGAALAAAASDADEPRLVKVLQNEVAGRTWRFEFRPRPASRDPSGPASEATVALLGVLASLLAWRLLQAQRGAKAALEARVAERTAELATANRQLRAGEERLALALAGGELAVYDWDITTGRAVWNERWWTMRGLRPDREPPTLRVWQDHIHPEDVPGVLQALQDHLNGRAPVYEREYRVPLPDGGVRWVADRGRVVERDELGRPLRMSGTNLDITERQLAEESRVQAETARRLATAKDEFVARMSHELRTPLNAILGFSSLLRMDAQGLPERQAAHVDHIHQAGEHLLALLNDLLDFAAIEAGRVPMQLSPQRVSERVEAALALLKPLSAQAQVTLAAQPPAGESEAGLQVQADGTRLMQVLLNLGSNAIKYNRAGGRVDVSWSCQGDEVRLSVRDTGAGLTDAQLQRLYQPFERLSASRSAIPGTGLGLVVTRRLVDLMGGRIEVQSTPGEGSCFTVVLPVAPAG